jgi:hypothetical protein
MAARNGTRVSSGCQIATRALGCNGGKPGGPKDVRWKAAIQPRSGVHHPAVRRGLVTSDPAAKMESTGMPERVPGDASLIGGGP